jgi:hypothetical protein
MDHPACRQCKIPEKPRALKAKNAKAKISGEVFVK